MMTAMYWRFAVGFNNVRTHLSIHTNMFVTANQLIRNVQDLQSDQVKVRIHVSGESILEKLEVSDN
jgi:hypothetical protein